MPRFFYVFSCFTPDSFVGGHILPIFKVEIRQIVLCHWMKPSSAMRHHVSCDAMAGDQWVVWFNWYHLMLFIVDVHGFNLIELIRFNDLMFASWNVWLNWSFCCPWFGHWHWVGWSWVVAFNLTSPVGCAGQQYRGSGGAQTSENVSVGRIPTLEGF